MVSFTRERVQKIIYGGIVPTDDMNPLDLLSPPLRGRELERRLSAAPTSCDLLPRGSSTSERSCAREPQIRVDPSGFRVESERLR